MTSFTPMLQAPAGDLLAGVLSPRTAIARSVVRTALNRVPVRIALPDGTWWTKHVSDDLPTLEIVRPRSLHHRIAQNPKIGIGEAYMAGDWRAAPGTDLADALLPFALRITTAVPPVLSRLRRMVDIPLPHGHRNSIDGSRRNIEAHYDLSNDMFATFLDETLSYSSALFAGADEESTPWAEQDLAEAQLRKIEAILDMAGVEDGSRVLEIGTGWGSLALAAARRGAEVVTVTLSVEQAELARERVAAAGLEDRIHVLVQDYREVSGVYDAIVSVEMVEAVGEEFWGTYLGTLDRLLAPGGTVALQSILMSHERYLSTRNSFGWIQKHIFPGGLIPSLRALEQVAGDETSLRVDRVDRFGAHYAETLRRWRESFTAAADRVEELGFDETFRRKWEFYLAYCEAGFRADYLDVAQIRLTRPEACVVEAGGEQS